MINAANEILLSRSFRIDSAAGWPEEGIYLGLRIKFDGQICLDCLACLRSELGELLLDILSDEFICEPKVNVGQALLRVVSQLSSVRGMVFSEFCRLLLL